MAQDIVPMDSWESECPCCGCQLALEWQLADYGYGSTTPQFIRLIPLKPRTIHNPVTGSDYPVKPRRRSQ